MTTVRERGARATPTAGTVPRAALCGLLCLAVGAFAAGASAAGAVVPGERAPAFTLPGRDGAPLSLADYRGEVVYLDFWASWCAPCLQSFPWMDAVADRYRARGLRVVAIALDGDRAAAERFLAETPVGFDVAFDPRGESAEAYALIGMPSSFVVGRDGRVTHAHAGFRKRDAAALEAAIERALADGGSGGDGRLAGGAE